MFGDARAAVPERPLAVLGRWYRYLRGRADVERSLRYSLALGLAATTLVTVFTYVAVGLWSGVEANPVMGWVIDAHGWGAFAAVRYAVVLGLFAVVWPLADRGDQWREWTEGNARLVAAVLWVNALRDGFVVATGVVPTFVLLELFGVF